MKNLGLLCMFPLLLPLVSLACSVRETTDEQKFSSADHVLLARVISVTLHRDDEAGLDRETGMVEATYEVIETFKGSSRPNYAREEIFGNGNCTMGFSVGHLYVLYLKGADRYAGWPGGSHVVYLWDDELNDELSQLRVFAANERNGN